MKYAPFPGWVRLQVWRWAPRECLLHCDSVQAHSETYMGLVEAGIGVIPCLGWLQELLQRWMVNKRRPSGPMPPIVKCFETISTANPSPSPLSKPGIICFAAEDGITMNRDRLLADAKARALALAENYRPPGFKEMHLPGATARVAMSMAVKSFRLTGKASAHDEVVALALARVLSGGDPTSRIRSQRRISGPRTRSILAPGQATRTLDRLEHMLETGNP